MWNFKEPARSEEAKHLKGLQWREIGEREVKVMLILFIKHLTVIAPCLGYLAPARRAEESKGVTSRREKRDSGNTYCTVLYSTEKRRIEDREKRVGNETSLSGCGGRKRGAQIRVVLFPLAKSRIFPLSLPFFSSNCTQHVSLPFFSPEGRKKAS